MHPDVQSPRPVRPPLQSRQLPTPSASSPRTLKRPFEDSSSNYILDLPLKKRCLGQPLSLSSSVARWLSKVPISRAHTVSPPTPLVRPEIRRPRTVPPHFAPVVELPEAEIEMAQTRPASVTSTANTRPSVSDSLYCETIYWNHIILDPTGMQIVDEKEIKELLDTHILKERPGSPPLSDEEVKEVVKAAADLLDNTERVASDLFDTKAFPLKRPRIAEGRNVQWSTDALPSNPKYPHQLCAPKPDRHYGYPPGRKFDWSGEEVAVLNHRTAQPYMQPTRDNVCPFLTLEFKSEATGGVLYVAENQGVGSGVHIVASQRWLQNQAFPGKELAATDAIAFVGAVSPRMGVFYIVWYSDKQAHYVMSMIRIVSFMESSHIQRCRDLMKNIEEYGLGERLGKVRKALAELNPVPPHWKKSRPTSVVVEMPFASFDEET